MVSAGTGRPGKEHSLLNGASQLVDQNSNSSEQHEESERKKRVNDMWEKMNCGLPCRTSNILMNKAPLKKPSPKVKTPNWMVPLGLAPSKLSTTTNVLPKKPDSFQYGTNEEARKVAAAALSAVKNSTSPTMLAGRGKVEITEVRDFAGQDIEVKRLVDADSKEAAEKAKIPCAQPSALDTILEQIKKKQKLSVLDKTKKDWSGFKEENKGLEEEMDAYKKSSNKYLDKVSFLQRTDLREFEREREMRLQSQAKRRAADMRDDDF